MPSLQPKPINLQEIQKQVITEILDNKRKAGEVRSDSEYQIYMKNMNSKLEYSKAFLKVREQEGLSDASIHNDTFEELDYDIQSVFAFVNQIDEATDTHQRLNQSLINNLKLRIKNMESSLAKFESLADIQDTQQIYYESFADGNRMEPDLSLHTERTGEMFTNAYRVRLDAEQEAVKLPAITTENALINVNGAHLGSIRMIKQLGSELVRLTNPGASLDKAIDTSMETYWSEQVMTDSPIQIPMGEEYYHINHGALCELEIRFDYLTKMNELGFSVFGEYPLDIVAVKYFETDNEEEKGKELIAPHLPLTSRSINGSTSYQFPEVYAKRLRLVFNQIHYVKNDFIASRKNQRSMEVLFYAKREDSDDEILFEPVADERRERFPLWENFSDMIDADPDIEGIMNRIKEDHSETVTKYEYNYGLYNLAVRHNEYHQTGVYVSRTIPFNGNMKTFSLQATEEHPEVIPGVPLTDIEYYAYDGKNWNSILPFNKTKITCELLMPRLEGGEYRASLRFPLEGGLVVRKNGQDVTGEMRLEPDNQSLVFLQHYDVSAYYTAEYIPARSAYMIDFLEKSKVDGEVVTRRSIEQFSGTNSSGVITLKNHPFVDKEKLNQQTLDYNPTFLNNNYLPIKVKVVDSTGYHIEQKMDVNDLQFGINNKTDYFDDSNSVMDWYDPDRGYEYIVRGNEVHFNTSIPASSRIIVEYPYLVSDVRVKAILRRNIHGFDGLTPILKEYTAHFQTLV